MITISLVDMQGRTHQSTAHRAEREGPDTIALDVTRARSGAYALQAITPEGSLLKMILISR